MEEVLEIITVLVVRATNIEQFRHPNGKRIVNMPFFEKEEDGNWCWRLIDIDVDGQWLIDKINEGRIYIFKQ